MATGDDPKKVLYYGGGGLPGRHAAGARKFPMFACIVAFFIYAISLKMLYSSWIVRGNPNGMIVVQGDPSTDDAVVTVTSAVDARKTSVTARVSEGIEHRLRFHLPPGSYLIDITIEGVHHPAIRAVDVKTSEATFITLAPKPSTRPATRDAVHHDQTP